MLDNLNLVHMNGRVYDPTVGRFLSVDPVFQFPTNTQSLNPYSYVLNNPLSLTDPTGYASCDGEFGCTTSITIDQGAGGSIGASDSRDAKGNSVEVDLDKLNGWVKSTYGADANIFGMTGGAQAAMVIAGGNGKDITQNVAEPTAGTNVPASGMTGGPSSAPKLVNNDGKGDLSLTDLGKLTALAVAGTLPKPERGDPESYRNISPDGVVDPDIHTCASNGACAVDTTGAAISVHSHQYQADGGPVADQGRNIWPGHEDQNMVALRRVVNVYRGADDATVGAIGLSGGEPYLTMLSPSSPNRATRWMARQWNNLMSRWKPNSTDPEHSTGVSDDEVSDLVKEYADDPTRP